MEKQTCLPMNPKRKEMLDKAKEILGEKTHAKAIDGALDILDRMYQNQDEFTGTQKKLLLQDYEPAFTRVKIIYR